jgi:hypothetical protein
MAMPTESELSIDEDISAEGQFHLVILSAEMNAKNHKGEDLGKMKLSGKVLNGTVESEKGKRHDFFIKHCPESSWEIQTRARLAAALNLLPAAAPGEEIEVAWPLAKSRQVVVTVKASQGKGDKADMIYYNSNERIFHVDDPAVKEVPRDAIYLGLIPAEARWKDGKPQPFVMNPRNQRAAAEAADRMAAAEKQEADEAAAESDSFGY